MTDVFLWNAAAVASVMLITWSISLMLRDVSIVDIVWGLGFAMIAWTTWAVSREETRSLLIPLLVTVWGVRLSAYLAWRNHGKPEDSRYGEMRKKHGDRFWLVSLFTVFSLQGSIMWIVSLPIQSSKCAASEMFWLVAAGSLVWLIGLCFEAVGDWQLAEFRRNPANEGKVLDGGLWRYTRHPNYFGDFCVWWGLSAVAIGCGAPAWCLVGPIVMSILLLRFSGVTLLEKSLKKSRPGYAQYVASTNTFFPGPPRNGESEK